MNATINLAACSRWKPPHPARYPDFVTVHYRWHPLVGQKRPVVRAYGMGERLHYEVQLDGYRLAVPAWMTDAEHCSPLRQAHRPVCSLTSLKSLHRLLAASGL